MLLEKILNIKHILGIKKFYYNYYKFNNLNHFIINI